LLGAVLGGAGGSALGKVGENAAEGKKDLGEGVAGEALLGGLTSTPIGAAGKVIKGGAQLAKGVLTGAGKEAAEKSFAEAGQRSIPNLAKGLQQKAAEDVATKSANLTPNVGVLNKVRNSARSADMELSGLSPTAKLSNAKANELYNFARTNGVNAGSPIQQSNQAAQLLKDKTSVLNNALEQVNRPLNQGESSTIVDNITKGIEQGKGVGKGANTNTEKFIRDINNAKDIKSLEALRKEADDLAFTSTGAGKTGIAKQAKVVRDAIDKHVSALSDDYKEAKGDFAKSLELSRTLDANSKSKGGLNLLGVNVGGQALQGAKSRATGKIAGNTGLPITPQPVKGQGILGAVARSQIERPLVAGALGMGGEPVDTEQAPVTTSNGLNPGDIGYEASLAKEAPTDVSTGTTDVSGNPFGKENIQNLIMQDYAQNGGKNVNTLLSLYKTFGQEGDAQPLSAEASKVVSTAQSGLDSLGQLAQQISKDPSVLTKSAISGAVNPLGITGQLLGTGEFETARQNVVDVIARLRTGAAISKDEEGRFLKLVPQAGDTPDVVNQKLSMLQSQFQQVANRTGSSGSDTQSLLSSLGG
jgi:hypothetical protein